MVLALRTGSIVASIGADYEVLALIGELERSQRESKNNDRNYTTIRGVLTLRLA